MKKVRRESYVAMTCLPKYTIKAVVELLLLRCTEVQKYILLHCTVNSNMFITCL